jgi:hypothetical protein
MTLGLRSAFGVAGFLLIAASGPGASATAGSAALPDTPLGRRVAAYVSTFNSGDEKAMIGFWTANFTAASLSERPVEARLPFYRRMRADMKTIVPVTVEESSATAIAVLMKSPEGEWLRLRFEGEGNPPYRLSSMRVETVDAPPAKPEGSAEPPKASDAQAAAAADEFFRRLASQD